jgi:hypothetical protein
MSFVQTKSCGIGATLSKYEMTPEGLLPVLGEKVAEPDEGASLPAVAIADPSPSPLPEYRERAVIIG